MNPEVLAQLATAVAKAGGPVLGAAIGGPVGSVVGTVIGSLADALGVDATPQAVQAKIESDPDGAKAVIQQVERDHAPEVALVLATTAAEMARTEMQSASFFKSGWRPAGAWMCIALVGWQFFIVPVVKSTVLPDFPPIPWQQVIEVFTWFLGLYMGGHTVKSVADRIGEAIANAAPSRAVVVQPNAITANVQASK